MSEINFGKFIADHRIKSGFKTQRDIAEKTGISRATISRIEKEVQKPNVKTIKLLAEHLYTTSLNELMIVCGYWDEDDLIYDEVPERLHSGNEKTSSYINEKEFSNNLELSNDKLLEKFNLTLDGKELSESEAKSVISFLRSVRQHNQ
ncbi:helix-turn-helix transcriptional regulator [Alkalihalophilus lindianensis]|uniref:Helix-turn-helix transcriptional regulator n=1 Tax=Alkalihalophilus lindianensis TaxID=1630542 RepID=A0ABU3X820_9BACI|nr:helix-turn-helix transcriptional regulator [Alkalihalophilus lindianensis]MDV2683777.1 helix-turn-helix transcriptional regulator [Alkalihalophilus lindianensis]MDV2683843.1 helix-turn-helix transcriptional regulator [Alkalihalophilus lindianensis]